MAPTPPSVRRSPSALALILLVFASGCFTAGMEGGARSRPNLLTHEEIVGVGATHLYGAVERLRPQWLRPRGAKNLFPGEDVIVVYRDRALLGGVDVLREMDADFVRELRFVDGQTASNTLPGLGSRAVAGAIIVVGPGGR